MPSWLVIPRYLHFAPTEALLGFLHSHTELAPGALLPSERYVFARRFVLGKRSGAIDGAHRKWHRRTFPERTMWLWYREDVGVLGAIQDGGHDWNWRNGRQWLVKSKTSNTCTYRPINCYVHGWTIGVTFFWLTVLIDEAVNSWHFAASNQSVWVMCNCVMGTGIFESIWTDCALSGRISYDVAHLQVWHGL